MLVGEHHGLDTVAEAELGEQAGDMRFDRGLCDEERGRDLGVRQPGGEQPEYLDLSRGQQGERFRQARWSAGRGEVLDEALGDGRGEEGVVPAGGDHCVGELLGREVLEQEAVRAGPEGVVDVLVEVESGEDDDAGIRGGRFGPDEAGGLDAVEAGHADVHEDHVRADLAGQCYGLCSVGGLAGDLDAGLAFENEPEADPYQLLVVRDEHPYSHGPAGTSPSGSSTVICSPVPVAAVRTAPPTRRMSSRTAAPGASARVVSAKSRQRWCSPKRIPTAVQAPGASISATAR